MKILVKRIHNHCQEDMETMETIQASFGLTKMAKKSKEERQVVLATALFTSLITYFTSRQLVQMSSDDESG